MHNELLAILEYIEQERGVSKEQLMQAVEDSILKAFVKSIHPVNDPSAKKESKNEMSAKSYLSVKMDRKTGAIKAWAKLEVVEGTPEKEYQISLAEARTRLPNTQVGEIVDWEVTPRNFGRIAAQTARQTILQNIRNAEQQQVIDEFKDQVGEIVTGTVRRADDNRIFVDLQKAEGVIEGKDRIPGERFLAGEHVQALLESIDGRDGGSSTLRLSRAGTEFVRKLFEREVSEIHDGVVEIMGIARFAGTRTKIAVRSMDPRVDPVGACVGMRGLRVRSITNVLGGERVDIVRYDTDFETYLANALQPAKINRIEVADKTMKKYLVHVDEENHRLALGKKVQNSRLAQILLNVTIEFVVDGAVEENEADAFEKQKNKAVEALSGALGIEAGQALLLVENGYNNLDGLHDVTSEDLAKIEGLEETTLEAIRKALREPGA